MSLKDDLRRLDAEATVLREKWQALQDQADKAYEMMQNKLMDANGVRRRIQDNQNG